jgi:hypothetical protein
MPDEQWSMCEFLVTAREGFANEAVLAERFAVIAHEEDQAVVVQAEFLEPLQEDANPVIVR